MKKRKLEELKEKWWNQNPEKRRDCEKQDDQTDGISIQNIGTSQTVTLAKALAFILSFRHVYKMAEIDYWPQNNVCLSVSLSTRNNSASPVGFSWKLC